MGKSNLLRKSLIVALLGAGFIANAQTDVHPLTFGNTAKPNYYKNFVGTRFTVTAPASVAGQKLFTVANNGSGTTGQWGAAVTGALSGDVARYSSDLAFCNTGSVGAFTGKIALIYRGGCEFGFKALAAQNNGAIAVIIVNNEEGGPVGMGTGASGASVTKPVFMISKADGDAINAALAANQTVSMSITPWGFGNTNDLGILINGVSLWHSYSVPYHQLANDNGNPAAYKNHDAAFVANFGSADQSNVQLKSTLKFTTAEGATSTIHDNTVTIPSLTAADSIRAIFQNSSYDVHASGKGRFDMTYEVSNATTDEFAGDNTNTYSFFASDNVYSKSRYDFSKNEPFASAYYQLTGGSSFTWGPLYYVSKGGWGAKQTQFSVSGGDPNTRILPAGTMLLYMFKWTDGLQTPQDNYLLDSMVQNGELELVATAQATFDGVKDSSTQVFTIPFQDINTGMDAEIPMEGDSWYWIAAETPGTLYLGVDGIQNYFPRSYVNYYKNEYQGMSYAPMWPGNVADIQNNLRTLTPPFPFDRYQVDSVVYSNQAGGLVPSISILTGLFKTGVQQTAAKPAFKVDVYPNPVVDQLTATVSFEKPTDVMYNVIDGVGRHIARETHTAVTNDKYVLDATTLAAGNYYISIVADGKVITRKVTITK